MFKQEKKYYQKAFFVTMIMAFVMFIPFVIIDGGYFIFYGDYNAQQIPFFKQCVEAVHNGTMGWDWKTDLGANFFGSYTYYTLGSPFFWFMCLFPSSFAPYLMMPLLCVKFGLFGLFAFIYIRRFVTKPQSALIGGLLYAFSSFNLYNVFFQFQDAMIWFPLLLIGLEEAVINKRRGVFALAMAINCLANYFFFIQECIFLVLYFLVRYACDPRFAIKFKDFLCLAFECIVGVLVAGVLFIPSIYQVLDVPRSTNSLLDWDFLFFGSEQRYGLLLESIFFPPEIAARNKMFEEANAKWSSVALYLPLFSMAGVVTFFKSKKRHWVKPLLLICLLFAFVPGLNASFTLFNNNYYTRWFYMPELICCLATAYVIEHKEFDFAYGVKVTAGATAIIGGLALLAPFTKETTNVDGTKTKTVIPRFMKIEYWPLWVAIGLAAATIVVLFILVKYRKKVSAAMFAKRATMLTIVFSMFLGYYFIGCGRSLGPTVGRFNKMASATFNIDDPDFYRIEGLNETNNANMFWGMSSAKSFQSIVPGSTFELYDLVKVMKDRGTRSVNSAPEYEYYAFRALTRVKYIMVPEDMTDKMSALNKLAIYKKIDKQGIYDIYTTDYALPMGFAYDNYCLQKDVEDNKKVDNIMIRAAVLKDEQEAKYKDILTKLDDVSLGKVSVDEFKKDAQNRIDEGVLQFSINKKGFTAKSSYNAEKLVCFSVPWCKGWSATVNGEPVEVDKINGGLCAIRVSAGESDISFTYETPGLKYGIISSIAGIVLLGIYMLYHNLIKRKNGRSYVHLYDQDQLANVKAHNSYIDQLSDQIYNCAERGGKVNSNQEIEFPDSREEFMDNAKYDFSKRKPKERNYHIEEGDEAYRVMEELDKQKAEQDEEDNDPPVE